MIDTNTLKGIIAANNTSQRKVALHLGMSEKTFYTKMKRGIFDSDEMEKMILLLKITDPIPVFFATSVTCNATTHPEVSP